MRRNEPLERALRAWLREHHAVIGGYEAARIGAPQELVRLKFERGEWSRLFQGVYCDAAAPHTTYQALRAAVVATRGHGVISHTSAGWLWGLLREPPVRPDISLPRETGGGRRLQGVAFHRIHDLSVTDASLRNGIPVTNPLRTIVDLAGVVTPVRLTEAVDVALAQRLVSVPGLMAEIDRRARRGRPGVAILRRHLLERGFVGAPSPSVLESKMLRIVARVGIEPPRVEHHAGGSGEYRLDLAWPPILFAVEVDGYLWHFLPEHQQRDNARRNHLRDAGWSLRIYTWWDVCHEPNRVGREILKNYNQLTGQAGQAGQAG
jgi:hypothetical protein